MVVKLYYTKESPSFWQAQDYAKKLAELSVATELVDADTPQGIAQVQLYDLVSRPAMALVRDNGSLVESWQHSFPLATDVSYLAHQ